MRERRRGAVPARGRGSRPQPEANGHRVSLRSSYPICPGRRRHKLGFYLFVVVSFCQSSHPVLTQHPRCAWHCAGTEFKEVRARLASAFKAPQCGGQQPRQWFGHRSAWAMTQVRSGRREEKGTGRAGGQPGRAGGRSPGVVGRGGEGMLGRGATGGRRWRERLPWVGVAGALGQAVASGDGAGAGLRRPTGWVPVPGWAVSRGDAAMLRGLRGPLPEQQRRELFPGHLGASGSPPAQTGL